MPDYGGLGQDLGRETEERVRMRRKRFLELPLGCVFYKLGYT